MAELTLLAIGLAIAKGCCTQAGKLAVTALWESLKTPAIVKEINASLKGDAALVQAISPPPRLDLARLTESDVSSILAFLSRNDSAAAGLHLCERQLVDLPMNPDRAVESYPKLWETIGAAILTAAAKAVMSDQKLANQFLVSGQQDNSNSLSQILVAISETHGAVERVESKLDSMNETTGFKASQGRQTVFLGQDSAISETTHFALAKVLGDTNKRLSELLGKQAESLWDSIVLSIRSRDYVLVTEKSRELEGLIESDRQLLPAETHGRALLMLAQVNILQILRDLDCQSNLTRAKVLVDQAKTAFGASPSQDNSDRLICVEAKLRSIEINDDSALALLGESSSPRVIATRLQILLSAGRTSEAVSIIDTLTVDKLWCEEAVFAFANDGSLQRSLDILKWIDSNCEEVQKLTARVALARGALTRLVERTEATLSVLSMGECDIDVAKSVLAELSGTIDKIREKGGPKSEIEAEVVALAYNAARLLGDENYRDIITLLKDYAPANIDYAVAMLRGDANLEDEFPTRLRNENPGWFHAHQLSILLEEQLGANAQKMMKLASGLVPLAKSIESREKLGRLLVQIATTSRLSVHDEAETQVRNLLGDDHPFIRLIQTHRYQAYDQEAFKKAVGELSDEDEPLAIQFKIQVHLNEKRYVEASDLLITLGRQLAEPSFLLHAAFLCLRRKPRRLGTALEALRMAVMLIPRDVQANRMLADLYYDLQDAEKAAKHYGVLYEIEPNETEYLFNQALCLKQANLPDKALACLSAVLTESNCNLEAHIIRAEIVSDMGNPKKAFKELHRVRERFWEDPRYVTAYINTAHASGEDKCAHEGFQKFWSMRCEGVVPVDVIQPKTLEDLIAFCEQAREKRNFLLDQNRFGKLPWLFVERLMNNVPYWAWRIRTQPMRWIFDDGRNRASFTVYSTNSFAVVTQNNNKSLLAIKAVSSRSPTVVDQTALMTLDRLGILDAAIKYFSKVLLPPSYMIRALQDRGKLLPHQLSQKEQLERIQILVVNAQIKVVADHEWSAVVTVSEHGEATGRPYVLSDLFDSLHRLGAISSRELEIASNVAHKARSSPTELRELQPTDCLHIPILTLQTIVGQGLEDRLIKCFAGICLSDGDVDEMQRKLAAFTSMEETRKWHQELWEKLREDNRVDTSTTLINTPEEHSITDELDLELDENHRLFEGEQDEQASLIDKDVSLDAALLAIQENLPLLVDDRVAQNFVLAKLDRRDASFGSDQLVFLMHSSGILNDEQSAQAILKLFEWRYRFIVCPATLLQVIAKHFAPRELLNVARYIHDCMRDPGLFGGMETTTSPSVIAVSFHQKWVQELAIFAVQVWFDDTIDENRSESIVKTVVTRMLPTLPETLGVMGARLASYTPTMFFSHIMHSSLSFGDRGKGNRLLQFVSLSLGMDKEELSRVVCKVINGDI